MSVSEFSAAKIAILCYYSSAYISFASTPHPVWIPFGLPSPQTSYVLPNLHTLPGDAYEVPCSKMQTLAYDTMANWPVTDVNLEANELSVEGCNYMERRLP